MIEHARWPVLWLAVWLSACGENSSKSFTTFQRASVVIGQADFTGSGQSSAPTPSSLKAPWGRSLVSGGKLLLPDSGDNRLLIYDAIPAVNGAAASRVLGQDSLDTGVSGSSASRFASVQGALEELGRLTVVDTMNSRLLIFSSLPAVSGAAADLVLGWDDINTPSSGCAQNRLRLPNSAFTVQGKLLVADTLNNRVLIWNDIPRTNGVQADLVLGQVNFTQCGATGGPQAATTLRSPYDVWSDGTRVAVADSGNNRVLIWNHFPTVNGAPADLVLGQANFAEATLGCTQTQLNKPSSISSNGQQLFVADQSNNRVLGWRTFPAQNGAPADLVLGQGDFTRWQLNDDDQDGGVDPTPTARTLRGPAGVVLWGDRLFVTDSGNNRHLIFEAK